MPPTRARAATTGLDARSSLTEDASCQSSAALVRYATRRGLLGSDEGDRLLADVQEAYRRRADRAADRARTHKAKGKAKSVKSVKTVKRAAKTGKRR